MASHSSLGPNHSGCQNHADIIWVWNLLGREGLEGETQKGRERGKDGGIRVHSQIKTLGGDSGSEFQA